MLIEGQIARQSRRKPTGALGFAFVRRGTVLAGGIVSKPSPRCNQSLQQFQRIIQDRVTTGSNDGSKPSDTSARLTGGKAMELAESGAHGDPLDVYC